MTALSVSSLYIGIPHDLGDSSTKSAIVKRSVESIRVLTHEIPGDLVSNLKHHGGDHRVLHHYPAEHYKFWNALYKRDNLFIPGSLGENLSAHGLTEEEVCIGDIFKIGSVLCQVTQPRKPCKTIDQHFNIKGFARTMQNECLTGWFYKIIQEGEVRVGDLIEKKEQLFPKLTLKKCIQALLIEPNNEMLEEMMNNPILSQNWKIPAQRILETGKLDCDISRLGD